MSCHLDIAVAFDPDAYLLQAILPFDLMLDRGKRIKFSNAFGTCSENQTKPKVVRDAGIALSSMVLCEETLERELFISTSYVPGMEATLSSRLKSLYSIYSKVISAITQACNNAQVLLIKNCKLDC